MKKFAISMGMVVAAGLAHADLLNISTAAVHSASSLQGVACTVVGTDGPLYRGTKILYVLAESVGNGRNPTLQVRSLAYNLVVSNDDWQKPYYINGAVQDPLPTILYTQFLRAPNLPTDAGVIYFAQPGEPLCVYTNERAGDDGLYQAVISITDRTAAITAAGIRSARTGEVLDPTGAGRAVLDQYLQRQSSAAQQ